MNYKKLGNTDLEVSTICLGTMTWGEQNSELEAFEQMDFALDEGVNFWDTAELYAIPPKKETFGHTETIIGNWFEKTKKREKVILASKVAGPARDYIRNGENSFVGKNFDNALNKFSANSGIICGGVAANKRLREKLSNLDKKIIYPSMKYCTDNADMIAFLAEHKIKNKKVNFDKDFSAYSRGMIV